MRPRTNQGPRAIVHDSRTGSGPFSLIGDEVKVPRDKKREGKTESFYFSKQR